MKYKLWKIGKELWELGDLASWNIEYVYSNLLIAKKKKKNPPIIIIEEGVTIKEFMHLWLQINKAYHKRLYNILESLSFSNWK